MLALTGVGVVRLMGEGVGEVMVEARLMGEG